MAQHSAYQCRVKEYEGSVKERLTNAQIAGKRAVFSHVAELANGEALRGFRAVACKTLEVWGPGPFVPLTFSTVSVNTAKPNAVTIASVSPPMSQKVSGAIQQTACALGVTIHARSCVSAGRLRPRGRRGGRRVQESRGRGKCPG